MAREFIARKGLIVSGSTLISGNVVANSFTGSLFGTSSWAVSSSQAVSASRAVSSSYATNALSASYAPPAAAFPYVGTARITGSLLVSGSITATDTITAGLDVTANRNLKSMYQAGDEGGELFFNAPATSTTINNGVNIDVYQDKLRFWEDGGVNRGFYLDIPSGAPGVGTNLKPTGFSGTVMIMGNPPGQQFLNYTDGILISVT
jgi:hypothetical protein